MPSSEAVSQWAGQHPTIVAAAAVMVAWLLIRHARARFARQTDPIRHFTARQKRTASARCAGRCEMEMFPFVRCRRPARHADHWYPHSRGGLTVETNLVMACPRCNLRKAARVPTRFATWRLSRRRLRYTPTAPK